MFYNINTMLVKKNEIIALIYSEQEPKLIARLQKRLGRMDEMEFIALVHQSINWKLEIVRKNTYLV
jgi:hypothetical protein